MSVAPRHLKRVLVFGYFGGRNFGDELMLIGLIEELRARGAGTIRIIAPEGKLLEHLEGEVERAYPKSPAAIASALLWASAFVICGGTTFHDSFSDGRHRAANALRTCSGISLLRLVPKRVMVSEDR